jgi:hypothetical protein
VMKKFDRAKRWPVNKASKSGNPLGIYIRYVKNERSDNVG